MLRHSRIDIGAPFFTSPRNVRRLTHAVGLSIAFRMPKTLNNIHRSIMHAGQSFIPSVQSMGSIPFCLKGYPTNWHQIRRWVLNRDGHQCRNTWIDEYGMVHRCQNRRKLHAHHLVPISKGGTSTSENLITHCESCHSTKHKYLHRNCLQEHGYPPIITPSQYCQPQFPQFQNPTPFF